MGLQIWANADNRRGIISHKEDREYDNERPIFLMELKVE
jgi:hypothetical protein